MARRTLVTALAGLGLLAAATGPAIPALTDSNPPVEATRLLTWSPQQGVGFARSQRRRMRSVKGLPWTPSGVLSFLEMSDECEVMLDRN